MLYVYFSEFFFWVINILPYRLFEHHKNWYIYVISRDCLKIINFKYGAMADRGHNMF